MSDPRSHLRQVNIHQKIQQIVHEFLLKLKKISSSVILCFLILRTTFSKCSEGKIEGDLARENRAKRFVSWKGKGVDGAGRRRMKQPNCSVLNPTYGNYFFYEYRNH